MVVVRVDAFSSGRMRRGLTMIGDVNFDSRKKALEINSDAGGYSRLFKPSLCSCALNRVLFGGVAQAKPLWWVRMSHVSP